MPGAPAPAGRGGAPGGGGIGGGFGPLPGVAFGQSTMGSIGQGIAETPEMLMKRKQEKMQLDAQKLQLDAAKQSIEQNAQKQDLAQLTLLGRMARNDETGAFKSDPAFISKAEAWAKKYGYPAPIKYDANGRAYVDIDSIPGTGGLMDLTAEQQEAFFKLNEAQRRAEYRGLPEPAYTAPQTFASSEVNTAQTDFMKELQNATTSGNIEGLQAFLDLNFSRYKAMFDSAGDGGMDKVLRDIASPEFQKATAMGAAVAEAKLGYILSGTDSREALAAYHQMLTVDKPAEIQALIKHYQAGDTRDIALTQQGWEKLNIDQEKLSVDMVKASAATTAAAAAAKNADTRAQELNLNQRKFNDSQVEATVKDVDKSVTQAQKAYSDIEHVVSTAVGQSPNAAAKILGVDQNDPTGYAPGSLGRQMYDSRQQLDAALASQAALTNAVAASRNRQLSSGSGKPSSTLGGVQLRAMGPKVNGVFANGQRGYSQTQLDGSTKFFIGSQEVDSNGNPIQANR